MTSISSRLLLLLLFLLPLVTTSVFSPRLTYINKIPLDVNDGFAFSVANHAAQSICARTQKGFHVTVIVSMSYSQVLLTGSFTAAHVICLSTTFHTTVWGQFTDDRAHVIGNAARDVMIQAVFTMRGEQDLEKFFSWQSDDFKFSILGYL
ncbi:hypothetical protein AXF42_Ash014859 [Apostasia shenzhenica]|uniref:Uncharacterized protein n=1 Tax=Apostasia shenzhenica TaxID=1088818 RepID=A0A2I0ALM0_9ASPA|nr:hypothetical protein AXF42_Ash014859 [Apostasia shenzhenica]